MTINQTNATSTKDTLKARRAYPLSPIRLLTSGQKHLDTVQTLTVRAMKSEILHIDFKLRQYA